MKKLFLFLMLLAVSVGVWGQPKIPHDITDYELINEVINRCCYYLNKPVPNDYALSGNPANNWSPHFYVSSSSNITLTAYHNLVRDADFYLHFKSKKSAEKFYSLIFDVLKSAGWEQSKRDEHWFEVYIKDKTIAYVYPVFTIRPEQWEPIMGVSFECFYVKINFHTEIK